MLSRIMFSCTTTIRKSIAKKRSCHDKVALK